MWSTYVYNGSLLPSESQKMVKSLGIIWGFRIILVGSKVFSLTVYKVPCSNPELIKYINQKAYRECSFSSVHTMEMIFALIWREGWGMLGNYFDGLLSDYFKNKFISRTHNLGTSFQLCPHIVKVGTFCCISSIDNNSSLFSALLNQKVVNISRWTLCKGVKYIHMEKQQKYLYYNQMKTLLYHSVCRECFPGGRPDEVRLPGPFSYTSLWTGISFKASSWIIWISFEQNLNKATQFN